MAIIGKINCDKCGASIYVDETGVGKIVPCPKCGEHFNVQLEDDGRDTPKTSAPRPSPENGSSSASRKCPSCGGTLGKDATECTSCGHSLSGSAEPPSSPPIYDLPPIFSRPHFVASTAHVQTAIAIALAILAPIVGLFIFRILDGIETKENAERARMWIAIDQADKQGIPQLYPTLGPRGTLGAIKALFQTSPKDKLIGEWRAEGFTRTTFIFCMDGTAKMILDDSVVDGPTIGGTVFWRLNYDHDPMCLDLVLAGTNRNRTLPMIVRFVTDRKILVRWSDDPSSRPLAFSVSDDKGQAVFAKQ